MSEWLSGHHALLVGAGSGIGRATLDAFLTEGARVAVLELSAEKCRELKTEHPEVIVVQGDGRSPDANAEAVAAAQTAFGQLDSATSFVGVFDHRVALRNIPAAELETAFAELFSINVLSTLQLAAAAAPALSAARGVLLLTLSNSAFFPGSGGVLYVASKFALRGVVAQLGHELAPEIRVNGVAPGGTVDTDLRGVEALGTADRRAADREGRAERMRAEAPLQIAPAPADHAGAYVYLASKRAAAVTGVVINSDGGAAVRG